MEMEEKDMESEEALHKNIRQTYQENKKICLLTNLGAIQSKGSLGNSVNLKLPGQHNYSKNRKHNKLKDKDKDDQNQRQKRSKLKGLQ